MQMQIFFEIFQYLSATNSVHIAVGDFNFGLLKELENNLLLSHFTKQVQFVNKPTYSWVIDRSCLHKVNFDRRIFY